MRRLALCLKPPLYRRWSIITLFFASVLLMQSSAALAHHPLDGIPMQYFWHGLLSGLAHPLLGIDHLFFIIAIAVTGIFSVSPMRTLVMVLTGVFVGIILVTHGVQLSWIELAVALSLVAIGALLFMGISLRDRVLLPVLVILSVFHGYAYGQALAVQADLPPVVVLGFLAGLPLIYSAVAFATRWLSTRLQANALSSKSVARMTGAVVACVGLVFI